ncbi:MAG: phosphatase PAP2 family protein [Pseudomonadota bacterium]
MEILQRLHQFDSRLLARVFRQGERRAIVPLARALSRSGDGYLHILFPVLLAVGGAEDVGRFALLLGLAISIERGLYWLLKNGLKRRRPQEIVPGFRSLIIASDQFSFPSGHTSAAFLLATALCLIYGPALAITYLWAALVALSRVILGVHFPGDTLAGALMGTSCCLFIADMIGLLA